MRRIQFDESQLARVVDFTCGSKPFQTEVSDWIKAPTDAPDGALQAIRDFQTGVWLYETDDRDIIGFASLGSHQWTIADPETKKKVPTPIQIIPNFAIRSCYKRKPEGVPADQQFASLIFTDLLLIAQERMEREGAPPMVGLLVYVENTRAIELYKQFGFIELGLTSQNYVRMVARLD